MRTDTQCPTLSVVICTYNRGSLLQRVLRQFDEQIYPDGPFRWELLLVDNNSTDDTRAIADRWLAERRSYEKRYIFEPRQGQSFALNTAIAESRGRFLAFTDDDVSLDPGWLSALHTAAVTYPHRCFGGRVLPAFDGPLPDWIAKDRRYAMGNGPLVREDRGGDVRDYDDRMWVPKGANMMIHRSLFDEHGGFDTRLGAYQNGVMIFGADTEIMFRFKRKGERILYYPPALVHHPAPSSRLTKAYFRKWWWGSGRGSARWMEVPSGSVRYWNVPRYLLKPVVGNALGFVSAIVTVNRDKRFYHELQLANTLGAIWEFYCGRRRSGVPVDLADTSTSR